MLYTPVKSWNDTHEVTIWTSSQALPNFIPRTLDDGRVCCGDSKILCDACYQNVTRDNLGLARAAEDAPCPYAKGLAKLRGDEHLDLTADLDPNHNANPNVPPDPYALAIALMKAKQETR